MSKKAKVNKKKAVDEIILDKATSEILKALSDIAQKHQAAVNVNTAKMKLIMSTYVSARGKKGNYEISGAYEKLVKVEDVKK